MLQKKPINYLQFFSISVILMLLVACISVYPVNNQNKANAATTSELQQKKDRLEQQIKENNAKADALAGEADSLQKKISQLDNEISTLNTQTELAGLKANELEQKYTQAQTELDRQKELLRASVVALYKKGGASTVELLVGSDSFTTFFNEQTYLERLKSGVQDSAEKVIKLKDQIKSQQEEQAKLLEQQKAQQALVASAKTEKQQVLAQTQGQEGEYRERSKQLLAEQRAAQEEIVKQSVFVSTPEPVIQVSAPTVAPAQDTNNQTSASNPNGAQPAPAPTPAPSAPVSSSYPYRSAVCVGTGRVDGPCYDFVWQMPDGRVIDEWTYYMRNCTSYVAFRIAGNGHSSAVRWLGNGGQWYSRAAAKGIAVGSTPRVGAAVSFNFRGSPYGHVAYVEEVLNGGSQFIISEYNMKLDGTYTSRKINTNDSTITGFVYF